MEAITPWAIIVIIFIILTLCVSFFICTIRNQVVEMNGKMSRVVEKLEEIRCGIIDVEDEMQKGIHIPGQGTWKI